MPISVERAYKQTQEQRIMDSSRQTEVEQLQKAIDVSIQEQKKKPLGLNLITEEQERESILGQFQENNKVVKEELTNSSQTKEYRLTRADKRSQIVSVITDSVTQYAKLTVSSPQQISGSSQTASNISTSQTKSQM